MIAIYDWFGYELTIKERYQLIKKRGLMVFYYGGVMALVVMFLVGTIIATGHK